MQDTPNDKEEQTSYSYPQRGKQICSPPSFT